MQLILTKGIISGSRFYFSTQIQLSSLTLCLLAAMLLRILQMNSFLELKYVHFFYINSLTLILSTWSLENYIRVRAMAGPVLSVCTVCLYCLSV